MKLRVTLVVLSCIVSALTGIVLSRGGTSGAGGAPSTREGRKPLIGLSLDTLKEERWQHDRDIFVKRAGELGAEVLVQAANSDDTHQISDVQSLISNKVDVLVIVPHNGSAMAKGVQMAHEAGIPVISYDRLITDSDPDVYMSFDNLKVGEEQAKFLVGKIGGRKKFRIVRINGAKTDNNALLFRQGAQNVLQPLIDKGIVQILHEDWAENWKPENAKKIMNAAITKYGHNFDAVLAANDGTAGGAIQALLEEGLAGKVLVTGQDAELAACQRIVKGSQSMTIYKPIKRLAERVAETAFKMAGGKPIVAGQTVNNGKMAIPSILLDIIVATKDNMTDTIVKDGFHKKEEVYSGS